MRQFEACIVPAQPFKLTISETIELLPSVDGGQEMADPKLSVWKIFNSSLHLSVIISDAQLPDTLRVVHTNLALASQFWTFWYQNLYAGGVGGGGLGARPQPHRTTRQTVSVDENTTPYFLPTSVDRARGKTDLATGPLVLAGDSLVEGSGKIFIEKFYWIWDDLRTEGFFRYFRPCLV